MMSGRGQSRGQAGGNARGYELDTALRRIVERLVLQELRIARSRTASGTGIVDANGNFVSADVEGALAELADSLSGITGDPIDRALAPTGTAFSRGTVPGFAIVQSDTDRDTIASSLTMTLGAAPTPGNVLIVWHVTRAAVTPTGPTGWTGHPGGTVRASPGSGMFGKMFYHVVEAGDGASVTSHLSGGGQSAAVLIEVAGIGTLLLDDAELPDTSTSTPDIDLTTAEAAFLIVGAVIRVSDPVGGSVTPDANTTELFDLLSNPTNPSSPLGWAGYRIVDTGGTYSVGGTNDQGSQETGTQGLAFAVDAPPWNVPEPLANDGDDATFEEIAGGTDVLVIDLGAEYRTIGTRLLIGCEFAGPKTYVIRGSVVADFDPDHTETLATLNFTATGSFTADEVLADWPLGMAYRYFELTGDDETRRVFTWEILQNPFALTLDHGALEGLADDDHPQYATDLDLDATDALLLDHNARHENGGADEVNVGGLSGLLADGQTPLAHKTSHQDGGSDEISVTGLSGLLADGQTPLAHKTSHQSGGSDAIKLDDLAAPDDNTDLNASTSAHGLLRKLSNTATEYLDGTGAWSTPSGGGGGGSAVSAAVVGDGLGNHTVTTTLTDVPGASITLTTGAHKVKVGFMCSLWNSSGNAGAQLVVDIDGVSQTPQLIDQDSVANIEHNGSFVYMTPSALSAGSHTFKIRWVRFSAGTASMRNSSSTNTWLMWVEECDA